MVAHSKVIGGIEIGTSKVAVLVGEIMNGNSLNIIGFGQAPSRGILKGTIYDYRLVSDCAHAAIIAAEKRAQTQIEGVYLAQTGGHVEGFYNDGTVNVSSPDNMVSAADISRVCEVAKAKGLPPNRSVIHHMRGPFALDGRTVANPLHLKGKQLNVGYWTVHGELDRMSDNIHIINGFSLEVEDLILSALASAIMVTIPDQRNSGILVLDIGCGSTDFVLYQNGYVAVAGTVPVAGDHLTNDLSLGLRISRRQAEVVKIRHGKAVPDPRDKNVKVWLEGELSIGERPLPQYGISQILECRLEELFQIVREKCGPAFQPGRLGAGVVITGGTSRLEGITEVAARVFETEARQGENPSWVVPELSGPEYSTILGLLYYGLWNQETVDAVRSSGQRKGLVKKLTSFWGR